MRSFDLSNIQKAGGATSQHAARESQLRNSVVSTFIEDSSAVLNAFTTLKILPHVRMGLEFLKFLIGIDEWILIVKANH